MEENYFSIQLTEEQNMGERKAAWLLSEVSLGRLFLSVRMQSGPAPSPLLHFISRNQEEVVLIELGLLGLSDR